MNKNQTRFYRLLVFVTLFSAVTTTAYTQKKITSLDDWVKGRAYHISYDFKKFGVPNPATKTIAGFDIILPTVKDDDFKTLAQLKPILYQLTFNYSKITDLGIKHISSIQSLQALGVSSLATDAACSSIKKLINLRWLSLSKTHITDRCIKTVLNLGKLTSLSIEDTKINGSGFAHINSNITKLNANGASINDAGLRYISQYKKIETLHLSKTKITNLGIQYLSSLPNLFDLNIGYNKNITDAGIAKLLPLSNQLIDLHMDNLDITDASVSVLSKIKSLKQLHLIATKITPQGLAVLKKALPNTEIRY